MELQLQYLCKLLTEDDIRQRLGSLPKQLTEAYDDIYQRNMSELRDIDPQYEASAKKVFHLMLSSHLPWSPLDMANMLDPAPNAALRQPEKVFGLTFHLVTHDRELNVLRFAHLSVREYFENHLPEFASSRNVEGAVTAPLDYLEDTRDFGFRSLSYPSQHWCSDVLRISTRPLSMQLADRLIQFLVRDARTFESWLRDMMEENRSVSLQWMSTPVDYLGSNDTTTVFVACALGLEGVLFLLINLYPNCVNARNSRGQSTVLVASEGGHTNIITILLQHGVDINERVGRDQDSTALGATLSASFPPTAVVKQLLENGADPNALHHGASTLHIAASQRCAESIELLLDFGADPNLISGKLTEPALYKAVSEGSCEIALKLLEGGACAKTTDGVRNNALHVAVDSERNDIVEVLLSFGADANVRAAGKEDKWSNWKNPSADG